MAGSEVEGTLSLVHLPPNRSDTLDNTYTDHFVLATCKTSVDIISDCIVQMIFHISQ